LPKEASVAVRSLKELMKGAILVMPGAFNGISARLVERAGFKALYVSGAGLANGAAAMPDIGLLTMTEVLTLSKYIIDAVDIPCLVDGETGFGEAENVMRTVSSLEGMGAAGVHIEDQVLPKKCGHLSGKTLVGPREMAEKIAAGVESRKSADFIIVARTDAAGVEGLKGAIERANLYVEAGADAVFPEALESREDLRTFKKEVDAPLLANMTEFGKTPYITVNEFEEMGYSMVIFPLTAMRVMLKSVKLALERLAKEGTQQRFIDGMCSREELYELLGYEDYEARDSRLAGSVPSKAEERKDGRK
jgi:methylisocitrate lyase